jgi:hypothetical protein
MQKVGCRLASICSEWPMLIFCTDIFCKKLNYVRGKSAIDLCFWALCNGKCQLCDFLRLWKKEHQARNKQLVNFLSTNSTIFETWDYLLHFIIIFGHSISPVVSSCAQSVNSTFELFMFFKFSGNICSIIDLTAFMLSPFCVFHKVLLLPTYPLGVRRN